MESDRSYWDDVGHLVYCPVWGDSEMVLKCRCRIEFMPKVEKIPLSNDEGLMSLQVKASREGAPLNQPIGGFVGIDLDDPYRERTPHNVADTLLGTLPEEDRESVLQEADRIINGQRQKDYGGPLESFDRIARLASIVLEAKLTEPLTAEDIAAFLLIALKGSRAIQGLKTGEFHRDSYVDIAGYAGCMEKIHDERNSQ
jgi:hypothetical protein